MNIIRK
jgi:hypothetical protein